MKHLRFTFLAMLLGVSLLSGCGTGYTRTLFLTKTNVGLDIAAAPKPAFELAVSRFEGVVAPQFEGGKKLPVMASFRFQTQSGNDSDSLGPAIGSTFAAGDAAIALSSLYKGETHGSGALGRIKALKQNVSVLDNPIFDSTLKLKSKPIANYWFSEGFQKSTKKESQTPDPHANLELQRAKLNREIARVQYLNAATEEQKTQAGAVLQMADQGVVYYQSLANSVEVKEGDPQKKSNEKTYDETDVRPVIFGTDTGYGLRATWSGMAGGFPDSVHLGFKRVEMGFVPIAMNETKDADNTSTFNMKMASLLATVDASATISRVGGPNVKLTYLQYFATGDAATLLAMQKEVRQAMLARMDPNQQKLIGTLELLNSDRPAEWGWLVIYSMAETLENDNPDKSEKKIVADAKGSVTFEGLGLPNDLKFYSFILVGNDKVFLENTDARTDLQRSKDLGLAKAYVEDLNRSREALKEIVAGGPFSDKPDGSDAKKLTGDALKPFQDQLAITEKTRQTFNAKSAQNPQVKALVELIVQKYFKSNESQ